ncbi:MAG: hypothetical protein WHV66_04475 [Anaerolineales bacterium]
MYNPDTELIFPLRVIPMLADIREKTWRSLVKHVVSEEANLTEKMGFVLLMVRLCGCITCGADSHRALRGCTQCARQVIVRFHGKDEDITHLYQQAYRDAERYLTERKMSIICSKG